MNALKTPALAVLIAAFGFACDDGGGGESGAGGAGGAAADMGAGGAGGMGGAGGVGGIGGMGGAGGMGGMGGVGGMGGMGGAGGGGCPDGAASCPCRPDDTCDAGLICDRGFCVDDPNPCDPGTQGCPCADGMCAGGLVCQDAVCVPRGCQPGTADCACDDGRCDGDLICEGNVCQMAPPPMNGLRVEGAMVFGCDVLFYERDGARVAHVTFDDALIGEHMRRDGKLALAFIGRGAPIGAIGAITLEGQRLATSDDLELRSHTCYDAAGQAVDGARVVLE